MKTQENMEQEIKQFDRTIEESMNGLSATPPFGMWNRISAELDAAEPAIAAGVAPITSTTIQRTPWRYIAAAAVTGIAVVGAFVYSYVGNNNTVQPVANNNDTPANITPANNAVVVAPVADNTIAAIEEVKPAATVAKKKVVKVESVNPSNEVAIQTPSVVVEKVISPIVEPKVEIANVPANNAQNSELEMGTVPNVALTVGNDKKTELETITVIDNKTAIENKAVDKKKNGAKGKLGKTKKDSKKNWNYLKD
jgi:hypothetical protein